MKIDPKQLAKVLIESTVHQVDVSDDMKRFVSFLAEHNILDQWRDIERAIEQVWKELYGASTIKVLSAHQLTQEAQKALGELAPGAELITSVDERLIGGAVIRIDDTRIDGSITGKLQRLKRTLQT